MKLLNINGTAYIELTDEQFSKLEKVTMQSKTDGEKKDGRIVFLQNNLVLISPLENFKEATDE